MTIKQVVVFALLFASFSAGTMNKLFGQESQSANREPSLQDTTTAMQFFDNAQSLAAAAHYDSAVYCYDKAISIYLKLAMNHDLKPLWENVILNFNSKALSLWLAGKYEEALGSLKEGLDKTHSRIGQNHQAVAINYLHRGSVYAYLGDYNNALSEYQRSLAISIQLYGEQHYHTSKCYLGMGIIYELQGKLDLALNYFRQASTIIIRVKADETIQAAWLYNNMGVVYEHKGNFDEALEFYEKSLSLSQRLLHDRNPSIALAYNNIGNIYNNKGDYEKALEFFHESNTRNLAVLGPDHPNVAQNYHNIANSYHMSGDFKNALHFSEKALSIYLKVLGEEHDRVALIYLERAMIYESSGDFENAIKYYHKALELNLQVLGEDHLQTIRNYTGLGSAYRQITDYPNAIESLQKAINIAHRVVGRQHILIAQSYRDLAEIHFHQNELTKALAYCEDAIWAAVSKFNDEIILNDSIIESAIYESEVLQTLKLNAEILLLKSAQSGLNDLRLSFSTYGLAIALVDKMRTGYKTQDSKLTLGEKAIPIYEGAIAVALRLFDFTQDSTFLRQAFKFAENSKAAVLGQALWDADVRQFSGVSDSVVLTERQLKIDLSYHDTQLHKELQKQVGQDSLKVDNHKRRHFALNQAYDKLIARLEKDYPKYHELKYQQRTTTVADVQRCLDDETAMIEYFISPEKLYIFLITKQGFEVHTSAMDSTQRQQVDRFRISIKQANRAEFVRTASALYKLLIEPISESISNKQNLIIIPQGNLYEIPFEALLMEKPANALWGLFGGEENDSERAYLIKKFNVSYHYSATLFHRRYGNREEPEGDFLAFAPVFPDVIDLSKDDRLAKSLFRSVELDGTVFGELESSREEVNQIGSLFRQRNKSDSVYLYGQATEENLKSKVGGHRYVHIATHGFINKSNPKMSGLILHQPEDSTAVEDGVLYAAEAYNLDLDADLVVLSSCESGVGKIVRGEGVMAMARGFLYSGALNILYSLWKVDDRLTSQLMVSFYEALLSGKTNTEALRAAKLKLIRDPETATPLLWSSFVLIGR